MSEVVAFKSGKDLREELIVGDDEILACSECRAIATERAAYEGNWQLAPPICPQCRAPDLVHLDACCQRVSS